MSNIIQTKINLIKIYVIIVTLNTVTASEKIDYVKLLRQNSNISEDGKLDFTGLARKYGHPAEVNYVITQDGYNLTLFHIPGQKSKQVLLVHGSGLDADSFIIRGNTSIVATLARQNYDIWVIALRGTIYSQRHISIDPVKEPNRFYNFSFYEYGIYDIPATIDCILDITKEEQLLIIGYSVGTTSLFVMGAERPEYNHKVKAFIALAPFCYTKHQRGLANFTDAFGNMIYLFLTLLGISGLSGRNQPDVLKRSSFCLDPVNYNKCVEPLFRMIGKDEANFEPEFMSIFFGHLSGDTTKKLLLHISQVHDRNEFAQLDYGLLQNMEVYHSVRPAKFDLRKVSMKVALFVGKNDYLATEKDAERLAEELPNVVHHEVLPYENFNHYDFVIGRYTPDQLYPYLLDVVKKYI